MGNQQKIAEELIGVMRLLTYPVTIITTAAGDRKRGVTIGSFTSLSMDPPLISFNVIKASQMHEVLDQAEQIVVHVPGIEHKDLCSRFAIPDLEDHEQFREVDFIGEEGDPPVLDGMIAEIYCKIHHHVEAGDHTIFIGFVEKVKRNRDDPSILYYDGEFLSIGPG